MRTRLALLVPRPPPLLGVFLFIVWSHAEHGQTTDNRTNTSPPSRVWFHKTKHSGINGDNSWSKCYVRFDDGVELQSVGVPLCGCAKFSRVSNCTMVMVKCARFLVCAARGGYFGQRGFGMEKSKGGCRVFRGRLVVFYQFKWNTEGTVENTAWVRQMETAMARWVRKAYPMGQIIHLLAAV